MQSKRSALAAQRSGGLWGADGAGGGGASSAMSQLLRLGGDDNEAPAVTASAGGAGRGGAAGRGGRRGGGAAGAGLTMSTRPVTRKILRKGSFVVQLLRGMVGTSQKIYMQVGFCERVIFVVAWFGTLAGEWWAALGLALAWRGGSRERGRANGGAGRRRVWA